MHPYRYDGSPGPYQALLERLATMGEAREPGSGDNRTAMPGWRDPFPYMAEGQLDAHLFDLRRMAERDQPELHEADDLSKTMGAHAITGAASTMHGLRSRQEALEIIEKRAEWLATYLTPERLDAAESWRDQKAIRGAQARDAGGHRIKAQNAMSNIRLAIQFSYTDSRAALSAWDKLVQDPETGGIKAAARQVTADPSILGKLEGGKTWFGLGDEDRDRLRARDRLADLSHNAAQFIHHNQLAQRADRNLKAIEECRRRRASWPRPSRPCAICAGSTCITCWIYRIRWSRPGALSPSAAPTQSAHSPPATRCSKSCAMPTIRASALPAPTSKKP